VPPGEIAYPAAVSMYGMVMLPGVNVRNFDVVVTVLRSPLTPLAVNVYGLL
jgi:hypothetical protein